MNTNNLPPLPEPKWLMPERLANSRDWTLPGAFTAEQMREYGQLCRQQALEDAAKVCESEWSNVAEQMYGIECAKAIRSMK